MMSWFISVFCRCVGFQTINQGAQFSWPGTKWPGTPTRRTALVDGVMVKEMMHQHENGWMILRHEAQEINIIDTNVVHSLRSHHFFHVTPFLYRTLSEFCRCDETSTLDQWFCSTRWRHVGVGNLLSISSNSRTSDCWVVLKFPEDFWDAVWIEHRQGWGCSMKWRTKCGRPKLIFFFLPKPCYDFFGSRYSCRCPQDDHRSSFKSCQVRWFS